MQVVVNRFCPLPWLTLMACTLVACGGQVPASERPVLVRAEDDREPHGGEVCRVVEQRVLAQLAELGGPALASTADGGIVVAWVGRESAGRQVMLQRFSPALESQGLASALARDEGMPIAPVVAACGQAVWVAWQRQEPREGDSIRLAVLAAADLRSVEPVTAGRGTAPGIACLDGQGALTWTRRHDGVQDIYLRWADATGRFGELRRLGGETDIAEDPAIACAVQGCGVVWSDGRNVHPDVYASFIEAGDGVASEPVRISSHDPTESGGGGAHAPSVATPDGLNYLVAWHDTRSGAESEVYAVTVAARGAPGAGRRISRSPAPSTAAAVAACDDRNAVAWRDRRDGPPSVMFAAVDQQGRRHSTAVTLSQGADEVSAPALVCGPRATFAVSWTESAAAGGQLRLALVSCR